MRPIEPPAELRVGPLVLDRDTRSVRLAGELIRLSPTEFRLLECLMAEAGRLVLSRSLALRLWGDEGRHTQDAARVALHRLRRKLEMQNGCAPAIETVHGVGVRLVLGAEPEARVSTRS